MNRQRVALCITMMQDIIAQELRFNMRWWQSTEWHKKETLEELHTCGSAACFGGYLALQPWFQEAGGSVGMSGEPLWTEEDKLRVDADDAVAAYLEVSAAIGAALTGTNTNWYDQELEDVTAQDVLDSLLILQEHGCLIRTQEFRVA